MNNCCNCNKCGEGDCIPNTIDNCGIDSLDLNSKIKNELKLNSIHTIGQLRKTSKRNLLKLTLIDEIAILEIETVLSKI